MTAFASLTELIKKEIKRQYKSIRQFSLVVDIPQSTLSSALNKGIGSVSFESAKKICDALSISILGNDPPIAVSKEAYDFISMYEKLDEAGRKTVNTIICAELLRSEKVPVSGVVKAFGGNTFNGEILENQIEAAMALKRIKEQNDD